MASILKVDTIQDQAGNNIISENANVITIGASGDTITVPAGATVSGFTSAGIDDNATSTAITIDSSERVGIGETNPDKQLEISSSTGGTLQLTNSSSTIGAGESLGEITFFSSDTSGDGTGVRGFIKSVENDGGTGRRYDLTFGTGNRAAATEKLRIDKDGNVGIGTSSPVTPLNVIGGSDLGIEVSDTSGNGVITIKGNATTGGSYLQFGDTDDDNVGRIYYTHNDNAMKFNTSDAEAMRIDSSGNVGIGTSSPSSALDVIGGLTVDGNDNNIQHDITRQTGATNASRPVIRLIAKNTASDVTDGFGSAIQFRMKDNTADTELGAIGFIRDGADGSGAFAVGQDSQLLQSSPQFIIDSSGNVGIGTSSPNSYSDYKVITLNGTTGGIFDLEVGGTRTGSLVANSTGVNLQCRTAQPLKFETSASERMRIESDGKVLVNTTSNGTESNLNVQGQFGMSSGRGFIFERQEGANGSGFTSITLQFTTGANGRTCFIESMVGSSGYYLHHIAHKYSGGTTNVLTNDNNGPTVSWSVSNSGSNTGSVYTYVVNFPFGTSHPYAKFKVSLGGYITTPITSPSITFTQ